MHKRIRYLISFTAAILFLSAATVACTPRSAPTRAAGGAESASAANPITQAPMTTNTELPIIGNSQTDSPSPAAEYIVKAGDTCNSIADEHNISVESFIETNKLAPDCRNLFIDQKLIVPAIGNDLPVTDTPSPKSTWPVYTLAAELPNSPTQARLYTQKVPAGLPNEQSLAALMEQLKMTGTASTRTSEAGDTTMDITGDTGSVMLDSVDPLIMVLNTSQTSDGGTSARILSPSERVQAAEAFLKARDLLDFPYTMEPPRLSRDRDHAIRIVPLIDGYSLYDYDPLNGRLLVWFNSAGEVSSIFWRPLKTIAGDLVDIQSAPAAWNQFVSGDTPKKNGSGQCWQIMTFDPNEPNANAEVSPPSCVGWGSGANRSYDAATINEVKLVYFANDLSLGMSPFAYPADSPAREIFPMWQFSGVTSDGRDLVVLWPAIVEP
jgi:LysM repeat protein